MSEGDVCLVDFCGRCEWRYPFQYWADWHHDQKVVTFGGVWYEIPDMPAEICPTEKEVQAWVTKCDPRPIEQIFDAHWEQYKKDHPEKFTHIDTQGESL